MRITLLFLLLILSGCATGFDPVAWERHKRIQKEMIISTEMMQRTGQLHDVKLKSSQDDTYDHLLIQLRAMQHNKTN